MFRDDADLFFKCPSDAPLVGSWFGVLYLLRRDIKQCMGINPNTDCPQPECQTLWSGAMAIMAGIDLLAKFYAGEASGSVGTRFNNFLTRYFGLGQHDQAIIYQLRNSLLHSFGLYSQDSRGNEYHFILSANGGQTLVECGTQPSSYRVDLRVLHDKFESAINQYKMELWTNPGLQVKFSNMLPNYGRIFIG